MAEPPRTDQQPPSFDAERRLHGLFVQGLAGDGAAYRECLKRLGSHLRAYFRRRLSQRPDDVEDLVQDTLLAVHNQRHTYRPDEPLTAWIHAIARYKLVDWLRAHAAREARHDPIDESSDLLAGSDDEAQQARRDLGRLLEQLPDRQRLPILHVKVEGLSVVETAQRIGMSESAVKIGIFRGLRALAAKVKERT